MSRSPKSRALGIALRNARKQRGLSQTQLGALIGRQSGEISRWETGERPLTPDRVGQILNALGINGERYESIVALAYDTKTTSWVGTTLPERQQQMAALIDFEDNATRITHVSPLLVPGLLQASSYVRSIMQAAGVPANEIATRVAVRVGRRDVLTRSQPAHLLALISEGVLHQVIGGRQTMIEQFDLLVELQKLPNVDVRIIPCDRDWHPGLEGAFTIIESDTSTPIVQLENRRSTLFLHEDDDVSAYQRAVDQLTQLALSPRESARLIMKARHRMERSNE